MQRLRDINAELATIDIAEEKIAREKKALDERKRALLQEKISGANSALREACQKGNLSAIQTLLSLGADIHHVDGFDGRAPFYERDSKKDKKHPLAGDAIHNAIRGDQPEALRLLLAHLVKETQSQLKKCEKSYEQNDYELQIAPLDADRLESELVGVQNFSGRLSHFLHRNNINIPCITGRLNSLLIEAILENSEKCVEMLLKYFSNTQYRRIVYGQDEKDKLISRYLDGSTFLVLDKKSEKYSYLSLVENYIYFGLDNINQYKHCKTLDEGEGTPIIEALKNSPKIDEYSPERVSYDPTLIRETIALCNASWNENLTYFKVINDDMKIFDGIQKGDALSLAIDLGRTRIAKLLINAGCPIEEKYGCKTGMDSRSWSPALFKTWDYTRDFTPLLLAATKNNKEIVQLLLEKGADTEAKDNNNKSAYELATDPEVRSIIFDHLSFLSQFTVLKIGVPKRFICPKTNKIFSDPIKDEKLYHEIKEYLKTEKSKIDEKNQSEQLQEVSSLTPH